MSSPGVEDSVIQRFGLQQLYGKKHLSEARKKFESNAQVKPDEKSGLISVTVIDRDPNRRCATRQRPLSRLTSISSRHTLAITDAARRRMFFEKEVDQTKVNLATAEDTLRDTIKKTGMLEPEGNARAMIAYQAQLRAEIAAKTVELQSKQVYLANENPEVQNNTSWKSRPSKLRPIPSIALPKAMRPTPSTWPVTPPSALSPQSAQKFATTKRCSSNSC